MENLRRWGWTPELEAAAEASTLENVEPARVVRHDLGRYRIQTEIGEKVAELPGRFLNAFNEELTPAVGDWVLATRTESAGDVTLVQCVLPRSSRFSRKAAGQIRKEQVVAANINTLFLVMGLEMNFNLNRLERYLSVAWESGAEPVVLLNKSDLCDDVDAMIIRAVQAAPGVQVVATSALNNAGLANIEPWLLPGKTLAFLGSSGVGKSTVVNTLLGQQHMVVKEVSAEDGLGQHTTTHRELIMLRNGAMVIDTPGMREMQLFAGAADTGSAFSDVEELAESCRFRDCTHTSEPGCAVKEAIEMGALGGDRLKNKRKLDREIARDERLAASADRRAQKERGRKMTRITRARIRNQWDV